MLLANGVHETHSSRFVSPRAVAKAVFVAFGLQNSRLQDLPTCIGSFWLAATMRCFRLPPLYRAGGTQKKHQWLVHGNTVKDILYHFSFQKNAVCQEGFWHLRSGATLLVSGAMLSKGARTRSGFWTVHNMGLGAHKIATGISRPSTNVSQVVMNAPPPQPPNSCKSAKCWVPYAGDLFNVASF